MSKILDFLNPFKKEEEQELKAQLRSPSKSFATPDNSDGAREVETHSVMAGRIEGQMAGVHKFSGDFEDRIKTTQDLILQYRSLAAIHEVDDAIQEIVDEAIVYEDGKEVLWLDFDATNFSDNIKKRIDEEFEEVVRLYKIHKDAYRLFRRWYVDSRIYFHKILDDDGAIKELRQLDPLRLDLVREVQTEDQDGVQVVVATREYYIYRQSDAATKSGWVMGSNGGHGLKDVEIPKSAIIFSSSGLIDECSKNKNIIGYLHRAIKPANQLKMLEDSLVIYRLARAPERRVFYIDVGQMQTRKAQQYVNGIMQGLKNRVVYDTSTGKVKNTNSNMAMLEDYYLPRKDGSKGTEVSTLPGGQNLGDIADILYFNRKLYKAMHIPTSRAQGEDQGGGVNFGGGTEITRDELKFTKFVRRLQTKFETIFFDALKHNLINKKVITEEEWEENFEKMHIIFNKDSYFEEQKELEIMNQRFSAMQMAQEYAGKYLSHNYIMRNILRLTDDEIKESEKEIDQEKDDPRFKDEEDDLGF